MLAVRRALAETLTALLLLVGLSACAPQPAGPLPPRALFGQTWTTNNVLLLGLGDSVTAGFGARSGYAYFERLLANPAEDPADIQGLNLRAVLPNLTATNLSVSGSTSFDCLEKQLPRLAVQPSNVVGLVVITTGGNDLIHNYGRTPPREGAMFGATWDQAAPWIANFEQRLQFILLAIQARFPGGCHIFLANIYDPTDGTGRIRTREIRLPDWPDGLRILAAYNVVITRQAARWDNVHLVDIHAGFAGHGIDQAGSQRWFHLNVEDPNERGYDALRRLFLIAMAQAGL